MKKRDKKLGLSRETLRELTTPENKATLRQVVGRTDGGDEIDGTCIPGGTTHCTNLC